jgi:hypothetical protein
MEQRTCGTTQQTGELILELAVIPNLRGNHPAAQQEFDGFGLS